MIEKGASLAEQNSAQIGYVTCEDRYKELHDAVKAYKDNNDLVRWIIVEEALEKLEERR